MDLPFPKLPVHMAWSALHYTLYDRIVGNVCHGTNPGPRPYLSKCEEKYLSDFLVEVAKAGYGKSRQQVKTLATKVVREKVATAGYKESQQAKPTKTTISGKCLLNPNKLHVYLDIVCLSSLKKS